MSTTFTLTNTGLLNIVEKTFNSGAGGNQNIVFTGLVGDGAGKYRLFLVNIVPAGAYIYRYDATNPTSDWITSGTSVNLSSTTTIGTYLTGFAVNTVYTVSVTILG
jgi:hypothetical protein